MPSLIQELEYRPQPLGPSSQAEAAQQVTFSFYNGELFRIAVSYDRFETDVIGNSSRVDAEDSAEYLGNFVVTCDFRLPKKKQRY